jgi:hypothetical protein
MSYATLSEFTTSIEEQFTDLGLELIKVDDELQWLYYDDATIHRATLSVLFWTGVHNRPVYRVEIWNGEPNEEGIIDGKIWNAIESVEQAIILLLKKIAEMNRDAEMKRKA